MKQTTLRTSLFASAALALSLAAPAFAEDAAEAPAAEAPAAAIDANADTVMATVNGEVITLGHVAAAMVSLPEQYQSLPGDVLLPGLVEQLIQQTVLGQAAGEMTRRSQIQLDNERRAIVATEKLDEVITSAVDDAAIQAVYDADYADAAPIQEWHASHILLETEEDAKAVKAELDGGADFAALAREKSTGPSGPGGGDLGWFTAASVVKDFGDAVAAMEVGEISAPVKSEFGWHVIELQEVRSKGAPALDEVRGDIVAKLENDAVEAALATLLEAAKIERTDITTIDPNVLADPALLD